VEAKLKAAEQRAEKAEARADAILADLKE
jgi:hypothetical protein